MACKGAPKPILKPRQNDLGQKPREFVGISNAIDIFAGEDVEASIVAGRWE